MTYHCEGQIKKWMAAKGYDVRNCINVVQLLNEIDYQARECGAEAEYLRLNMKRKSEQERQR